MKEIKFNSLEELYIKLKPALNTKVEDFKRSNIKYISEEDIWNYLRLNKWNKSKNLTLAKCVDDILNVSDIELKQYLKNKMSDLLAGGVK